MRLYDVEFMVTMRVGARDSEDAQTQAFLTVEENLYGSVIMAVQGPDDDSMARVQARAEETGLTMELTSCHHVVTAKPYAVA